MIPWMQFAILATLLPHPLKSEQSGLILDVEPGEAEWTLEVSRGAVRFLLRPSEENPEKRDAMNAKLAEARKPHMK